MVAKGHLLILLHSPPRADEDKREPCLFWRDPGHNWRSRKFGTGTNGLSRYLEGYEKMTDNLQRRVLEEQSAQELFETLNEIGPLHRSAHNTHTALQQAREMMADDTDIIDLRDHAEEIARTLELLSHEAKNALDYRVAAQAERQSASAHVMTVAAHRLSILAAVFFPLVTLTSIFGMNLDSGIISTLGEESSFWVVIITGLVIGGILAALLRRRPIAQSAG